MSLKESLPKKVVRVILESGHADFATISAKAVPIDTPLLNFPDTDLAKITMATGLAYPTKAERARRNPKVGLLYYPTEANEPVVQIVGIASVRDSNIQQNMLTYLAETGYILPEIPWEIKRQAVWYWARILIEVRPRQVLWWDNADLLDRPPNRWDAPANDDYPPSDPSPSGSPSAAPNWGQPAWREMAQTDVKAQYPAHLTTIDEEGFPRIMRASRVRLTNDGFQIDLPHGTPGLQVGSATLTYFGRDTFVGTVHGERGTVSMSVERALPILPTVGNPSLLWNPTPELKSSFMIRLEAELARRGQAMPIVPQTQPQLTDAAKRRGERDTKGGDEVLFEKAST